MEFAIGSDITISVVPQDGYHLKSLMLNGKDVLSEMTDRSYIIEKLDANYVVDAEFAENPVKLRFSWQLADRLMLKSRKEPHSHVS